MKYEAEVGYKKCPPCKHTAGNRLQSVGIIPTSKSRWSLGKMFQTFNQSVCMEFVKSMNIGISREFRFVLVDPLNTDTNVSGYLLYRPEGRFHKIILMLHLPSFNLSKNHPYPN